MHKSFLSSVAIFLFGLGFADLNIGTTASAAGATEAAAAITSDTETNVRNFTLGEPQDTPAASRRPIWVTAYIVHPAQEDTTATAVPLITKRGKPTGVGLSHADWCHAAMEGTVVVGLATGGSRTFHYAGTGRHRVTDCSDVFSKAPSATVAAVSRSLFAPAPADAPFGLGARSSYRLVPYRSIAVDLDPAGPFDLETVLFIPELKGMRFTLPDGRQSVHDGYVVAVDRGGLIRGNHVDFFKGPSRTDALPAELRSSEKHPIDAYLVTDAAISSALLAEHKRR